jgi:hypothetical protein
MTGTRGALLLLLCAGSGAQEGVLTWRGRDLPSADVAAECPGALPALRQWSGFASRHGYRLVLADDGDVLLVLSASYARPRSDREHREVDVFVKRLAQTTATVRRFVPPPPAGPPLVVVAVRNDDYGALLEHVRAQHAALSDWTKAAAATVAGFVLSEPLLAAWIEDPPGVEEWQPTNELVHRTAQLLIRQHAPDVPAWLLLGLGWHVEDAVQGSIYCFPHRSGFVSIDAHTDWGLWLANNFKKSRRKAAKRQPVLEITEFADWRPRQDDEFATGKAYLAFGVARYLAHEHPKKLDALLITLGEMTAKGRKVWISETEWKLDPEFQPPLLGQLVFLEAIQPDFLTEVTTWFLQKKANRRTPK